MARTKIIPDSAVFTALRHLMVTEGPQAASFRAIGRATGLAPATLVQRYGNAEKMLVAALNDGWDIADAALATAAQDAPKSDKGATALLKALAPPPLIDHPVLLERAAGWRRKVLQELTLRLGNGQAAAMLFAAWQGRLMWDRSGARGFSLRDLVRKLI